MMTIHRVVDGTITDTGFLHSQDDLLEGVQVVARVTIELDVADMPGIAMMVELSPTDRAILRAAGGSGDVVIAVDSKEIARASNRGNKQIVSEGGRP
jgi:hypothetical protein